MAFKITETSKQGHEDALIWFTLYEAFRTFLPCLGIVEVHQGMLILAWLVSILFLYEDVI